MSSILSKISTISNYKSEIKSAIISKGESIQGNSLDEIYVALQNLMTDTSYADPYFNNTDLLLHSESPSGLVGLPTNNNIIVDSSDNNLSITKNGDVGQGMVGPSTTFGSYYFSGSNEYLSIDSNSLFNFGILDFTIEFWFNISDTSTDRILIDFGSGGIYIVIMIGVDKKIYFKFNNTIVCSSISLTEVDQWYHFAISRNNGVSNLFLNGVLQSTAVDINNYSNNGINIGVNSANHSSNSYYGYISNIRISKGIAIYTTDFIPSDIPLTANQFTSLLLLGTNAVIYDSTGKNIIQTIGNANSTVVAYKYGSSSIYFDGNGDYLYIPDASSNFSFGINDFTIEGWINPGVINVNQGIFDTRQANGSGIAIKLMSGGSIYVGNGTIGVTTDNVILTNTWSHIAIVRISGIIKIFINGILVYSGAFTLDAGQAVSVRIGITFDGFAFNGYIDEFRITSEVARYSTNFTVPSTQFYDYISNYYITSINIQGNVSINDNSATTYTCVAHYNDDTSKTISPVWSLTNNSISASINSGGILTVPNIEGNASLTINALYIENGVSVTSTLPISISDTYNVSSISIDGESNVNDHTTSTYECIATMSDNATKAVVPIWSLTNNTIGCSINSSGVLTVPDISASGSVTLNASYTESGVTITATKNITLNDIFKVSSITITGNSTQGDNSLSAYTCTATMTDSTTKIVSATWSLTNNVSGCTINSSTGTLTIPDISSNGSVTINASYTENGVTVTTTKNVTLTDSFKVSSITINGNSTQSDNSTTTYTCAATMTDSSTKTVSPTWNLTNNAFGCTINGSTGVLSVPDITSSGSVTINASYTENGTTVTTTKTVTLTDSFKVSSISISGSSAQNDLTTTTYTCTATMSDSTTKSVTPIWSLTNNTQGCSINSITGVLTIPDISSNGSVTVNASYTENGVTVNATKSVTLTNVFMVSSITINGSSAQNDLTTTTYTCTATMSDSTTKSVTPTWSLINNTAGCTINISGLLTIPDISSNGSVTVNASYTENGVTVNATKSVTLTNVYKVSTITINGSSAQNDVTTTTYTCTATMSDSTTKSVTPTWSLTNNTAGCTINSSGLLTIPDISSNGSVTVNASYTENGVTVNATKSVTLTNVYKVSTITINGVTSQNDNSTTTYTCTATMSDSTTKSVTPSWSLTNNASSCTINSGGLLTVPDIAADGSVTVNASYTENGTTVTATKNVTLVNSYVAVSGRGYWAGGQNTLGTTVTKIDGIDFSNESAITPTAVLVTPRYGLAGVTSTATGKGYYGGGYTGSAYSAEIDGIVFSTETAVNPSAVLAVARVAVGGVYSSSKGYWGGGSNVAGTGLKEIDGITFSTETAVNPATLLNTARHSVNGVNSNSKGYFGGGGAANGVYFNEIDGIDFSNDSLVNPSSTLSVARQYMGTVHSSSKGYWGGGMIKTTLIDCLTFSTEGATSIAATLSVSRGNLAGVSSTAKGYFGGGIASTKTSEIDGIDFTTDNAINPAATLSVVRDNLAGGVQSQ